MIGRATYNDKSNLMPDHYEITLEWIFQLFVQLTQHRKGRVFEVYTGILDTRHSDSYAIAQAKKNLQTFASSMNRKYNFPFTIIIKKETGLEKEIPHDRYLITDQIDIQIGRGYDFLFTDQQMKLARLDPNKHPRPVKDLTISLINAPNKIVSFVKSLPNL